MTIISTSKPLNKRRAHDFYPTPLEFARAALAQVPTLPRNPNICDPGAGAGVWGKAARELWHNATITGIELRDTARPQPYNFWIAEDFRLIEPQPVFDLVMGNPPYTDAELFIRMGMQWLTDGGAMVMLLRLAMLASQGRGTGLWREYPPESVAICTKRPSFTGDGGTDDTEYAFYYWRKGYRGETRLTWVMPSALTARGAA